MALCEALRSGHIEATLNDRQRSLVSQGLDKINSYLSHDPRTLTDNLITSTDLAMFVIEVGPGFAYAIRGKQLLQQTSNATRGGGIAASLSDYVVKDGLADKFIGDVSTLTAALRKIEGQGSTWLRKIADRFDEAPQSVYFCSDGEFDRYYLRINGAPPRTGERVNGFFKDGAIYLRRSSGNQILRVFVHEATHALDMGVGGLFTRVGSKWKAKDLNNMTAQEEFKREIRVFRAERFVDGIPHFLTRRASLTIFLTSIEARCWENFHNA